MKVYTKLIIGALFFTVLIIGSTIPVYVTEREIEEESKIALEETLAALTREAEYARSLENAFFYSTKMEDAVLLFASTEDPYWKAYYYNLKYETGHHLHDALIVNVEGYEKEYEYVLELFALQEQKEAFDTEIFLLFENNKKDAARTLLESEDFLRASSQLEKKFQESGIHVSPNRISSTENVVITLRILLKKEASRVTGSLFLTLFILGTVVAFMIISLFSYANILLRPLKRLKAMAADAVSGDFRQRYNLKTGDEFEDLGNDFNKMLGSLETLEVERRQLEKAKTEFLSITSHELRSPMTPMQAQLEMLKQEYYGKLKKKQKQAIDIVLRNCIHLDNLIVDLLEISRIEAARLNFTFIMTKLTPFIKDLIREMAELYPEKNIKIETDIRSLPVMEVDPNRCMQVLRNLVENAKKFSPKNSTIKVSVKKQGHFILFLVRDQGFGISEDQKVRIFSPFYQAEQTIYRKYRGAGLGLAICKGIVESQGGEIGVESRLGYGSTFFFTVPIFPVKSMKPINILFSAKERVEVELKKLFTKIIGPLGIAEFEELQKKGLKYEDVEEYVHELHTYHVLDDTRAEEMRQELKRIYSL